MTGLRRRRPRVKLRREEYDLLRKRVLERDGWRCQECGSMNNLQVHHKQARSQLGDDAIDNLIAFCAICHRKRHEGR